MYEIEDKTRIALQTLFMGAEIEIDGYKYQMSEDYDICSVGEKITLGANKTAEQCLLRTFITVQDFIKMCKKISDEDIMIMVANLALNKVKNAKY